MPPGIPLVLDKKTFAGESVIDLKSYKALKTSYCCGD
jgi:hypothetical protein